MRCGPWTGALGLAAAIAAPAGAESSPGASTPAEHAWGFDRTDLPPHPEVRFGVLGNGMRYAVMRNTVPAGGLAVRFRIDVGTTSEGEREQGFVHLLEHLVFHGSENIPQGGLLLMLAHQGLRRWSGFNAFTSYNETVYRLDLPRADKGARTTGLNLMREIASALRFNRRIVEGAKQDVLAEIAGRDRVQDRIGVEQNRFFFPGAAIARGPVTGSEASVARASTSTLRRLYRTYYVPRRATLVLVGDFDPAAAEAEVAAHFSDWRQASPLVVEAKRPASSELRPRGTEFRLLIDAAAPTSVAIASVKPLPTAGDQTAERDEFFLVRLANAMLGRRLARLRSGSRARFDRADVEVYDYFRAGRVAMIDLAVPDRDWRRALQVGEQALRAALTYGFTQPELDEQLAESRHGLAAAAVPRAGPAMADAIVEAAGLEFVFTRPADPTGSEAYLARVALADVNAALRTAWSNPSRLVFVTHDQNEAQGEAAAASAWEESRRMAVTAPAPGHLAVGRAHP